MNLLQIIIDYKSIAKQWEQLAFLIFYVKSSNSVSILTGSGYCYQLLT